jgi:uncharacterized protein (DUF779 family)
MAPPPAPCGDGSPPISRAAGGLLGPNDLLLGEVGDCPLHIDAD